MSGFLDVLILEMVAGHKYQLNMFLKVQIATSTRHYWCLKPLLVRQLIRRINVDYNILLNYTLTFIIFALLFGQNESCFEQAYIIFSALSSLASYFKMSSRRLFTLDQEVKKYLALWHLQDGITKVDSQSPQLDFVVLLETNRFSQFCPSFPEQYFVCQEKNHMDSLLNFRC